METHRTGKSLFNQLEYFCRNTVRSNWLVRIKWRNNISYFMLVNGIHKQSVASSFSGSQKSVCDKMFFFFLVSAAIQAIVSDICNFSFVWESSILLVSSFWDAWSGIFINTQYGFNTFPCILIFISVSIKKLILIVLFTCFVKVDSRFL